MILNFAKYQGSLTVTPETTFIVSSLLFDPSEELLTDPGLQGVQSAAQECSLSPPDNRFVEIPYSQDLWLISNL